MACFSQLRVALFGAAAISSLLALSPALAQETETGTASVLNPNDGFTSPDGGSDLFSDPMGPMDLIHRAVLMNDMSLTEFRQQQQDRISSEAANFRQLQQQAIRQQAQPTPQTEPTDGNL